MFIVQVWNSKHRQLYPCPKIETTHVGVVILQLKQDTATQYLQMSPSRDISPSVESMTPILCLCLFWGLLIHSN